MCAWLVRAAKRQLFSETRALLSPRESFRCESCGDQFILP